MPTDLARRSSRFARGTRTGLAGLHRDYLVFWNGLLPFKDFASVLLAAWLTTRLHGNWTATTTIDTSSGGIRALVLVFALLASVLLHDRRFGSIASRGQSLALLRCYVTGFLLFTGGVLMIGTASRVLSSLPGEVVGTWLALCLLLTSFSRLLLAARVQSMARKGQLAEVVAIVGAGPLAERLIQHLRLSQPMGIDLLGVFDDGAGLRPRKHGLLAGDVEDLIDLGKTQRIDWILLTPRSNDEAAQLAIVDRLKALSTPVALCPQDAGLGTPYPLIGYLHDGSALTLLANPPPSRWRSAINVGGQFLPRWILTMLLLPTLVARLAWSRLRTRATPE